jgi:single-strand DNA-binding protein
MNNLNSILLEGNLTRDPEKQCEVPVCCSMWIASNRYYKKDNQYEQEVSYFEVKAWNKLGEVCLEHLKKGRGIRVIGRLKQERWEDKEGQKHSKVIVLSDHIEFKPEPNKEGK